MDVSRKALNHQNEVRNAVHQRFDNTLFLPLVEGGRQGDGAEFVHFAYTPSLW